MKSNKINSTFLVLISVINILFFIYYVLLAIYSELPIEELQEMSKMNTLSFTEYVENIHFTVGTGRLFSYTLHNVIYSLVTFFGKNIIFWPILFYVLGLFFCWFSVKDIAKSINSIILINAICLFYNIYILINIGISFSFEVLDIIYYLLMPLYCVFICYLNKEELRFYECIVLILLTIIFSVIQVDFILIILLSILINILYYFYKISIEQKNVTLKDLCNVPQFKRMVCVVCGLIFLFLLIEIVALTIYLKVNNFFLIMSYIPALLILFFVAYYIGSEYGKCNVYMNKRKYITCILIALLLYTFISYIINVYINDTFFSQGLFSRMLFAFLLCITMGGYVLGVRFEIPIKYSASGLIGMFIVMAILSICIYKDIIVERYSKVERTQKELLYKKPFKQNNDSIK